MAFSLTDSPTPSAAPAVIVATGGIGSGITMELQGNHTLGREESRAAHLDDADDYCKLHIVTHYLRRLLPSQHRVLPVGRVGNDDAGRRLLDQLAAESMDLRHVTIDERRPTLFAVCFAYPNGDGGNLTTTGSASDEVHPAQIREATADLVGTQRGMVVALPEVPFETRAELLRIGTEQGHLRIASFVTAEIAQAVSSGLLEHTDLVALNFDEARALASGSSRVSEDLVREAVDALMAINPDAHALITAGAHGSWTWDSRELVHHAGQSVTVVNTAGAGDSHLAGLVVGLALGATLHEANALASVVSALKVGGRHSINFDIDGPAVLAAAREWNISLSAHIRAGLSQP